MWEVLVKSLPAVILPKNIAAPPELNVAGGSVLGYGLMGCAADSITAVRTQYRNCLVIAEYPGFSLESNLVIAM